MMALLSGLVARIGGRAAAWAAAIGAGVLGLAGILAGARRSGRDAEKLAELQREAAAEREAGHASEAVANLSDAAVSERLRDWRRPG